MNDFLKIENLTFVQFLASFAQNLIIWQFGLILAIPSIVVPSVIGVSQELNPDETLHMTAEQASWLGYNFN